MTPAEALAILRESCYPAHDARIWHDGGRRITALARTAGVTVTFARVDLTALATEFKTVDIKEEDTWQAIPNLTE